MTPEQIAELRRLHAEYQGKPVGHSARTPFMEIVCPTMDALPELLDSAEENDALRSALAGARNARGIISAEEIDALRARVRALEARHLLALLRLA